MKPQVVERGGEKAGDLKSGPDRLQFLFSCLLAFELAFNLKYYRAISTPPNSPLSSIRLNVTYSGSLPTLLLARLSLAFLTSSVCFRFVFMAH